MCHRCSAACAACCHLLLPWNRRSHPAPASQARPSPAMGSQLRRVRACTAWQVEESFHWHTVLLPREERRWLDAQCPVRSMSRSPVVQAHALPRKAADLRRTSTRAAESCSGEARGCVLAARRRRRGSATPRRVARASWQWCATSGSRGDHRCRQPALVYPRAFCSGRQHDVGESAQRRLTMS